MRLFRRGKVPVFSHGIHEGDQPGQVWQTDPTYMRVLLASGNVSVEDKSVIESACPESLCRQKGARREFTAVVRDGKAVVVGQTMMTELVPAGESAESLLGKWREEQEDEQLIDQYWSRRP